MSKNDVTVIPKLICLQKTEPPFLFYEPNYKAFWSFYYLFLFLKVHFTSLNISTLLKTFWTGVHTIIVSSSNYDTMYWDMHKD